MQRHRWDTLHNNQKIEPHVKGGKKVNVSSRSFQAKWYSNVFPDFKNSRISRKAGEIFRSLPVLEVGQILTKIKASGRSDTSDYRTNSRSSHKVHNSSRNAILWKPLSSFVTKWPETRCTTHFGMPQLQRTVRQHTFKCWCVGPVELSGPCELQFVILWWSQGSMQ